MRHMGTTPRGPLPPSVYWRRRAFVGLLVLAVVFIGVSWLQDGSDGSSDEAPVAQQAAEDVAPSHTVTAGSTGTEAASRGAEQQQRKQGRKKKRAAAPTQGPTFDPDVLAEPEGRCRAGDIIVRPEVEDAVGGRDVTVGLSLQTLQSEACTWKIAPRRVAVKISGRSGTVWTSQECRDVVPTREIVVRRAIATLVELTWDARESDRGCTDYREWLLPGRYRVQTATLGGEPHRTTFLLAKPEAPTVTPEPTQGTKQTRGKKKQGEKTATQRSQQREGSAGADPQSGSD